MIARSYAITYDMPVGVTRFANIYGGGDLNWSRIVPDTSRSLIKGEAPVIRSDGSPERDLLYVEDDSVNFTLVERILEYRPGVTVMHAPQGELGCELAETYRPKLILLDLNLPDMHGSDSNGDEVLASLRRDPCTSAIPVVILSADATPSQIERLLTAGAKNYVTKPFDIEQFLAVVDEYLNAAKPRK